jgi:heptosyltransferase-2
VEENILICGVNWLGDSIMSMPAVQLFRKNRPAARLTVLAKAGLVPLWRTHKAIDAVQELRVGLRGTIEAAQAVKSGRFDKAFVFPNSFRSALIPFLAGVPARVGVRGHQRAWMLTEIVRHPAETGRRHQAWEYVDIMGLGDGRMELEPPRLSVPEDSMARWKVRLGADDGRRALIGFLPGAARGPSKRWPDEYFIEAGRQLIEATGCRVVVLGLREETDLCQRIASGMGQAAVNLAGQTPLADLAAVLSLCRLVVGNDSGGTHLAAATGARVVVIFGLTDPGKTGPLGANQRIIIDESVPHSREIASASSEAGECLRAIAPERVWRAALELLSEGGA